MIADALKQPLDPWRETGGWSGNDVGVYSILNLLLNLTQSIYSYLLCSYLMSCFMVYLVCYASFVSYINQIGHIIGTIQQVRRTPRITKRQKYHKGKWKHIPIQVITRRHNVIPRVPSIHAHMKSTHKKVPSKEWDSVHQWHALLDSDYSSVFEYNYTHYVHYLDTTMENMNTIQSLGPDPQDASDYTSIEDDIFIPKGCYAGSNTSPIIADSGYTIAVTPHLSDFICPPTPFNKSMKERQGQ